MAWRYTFDGGPEKGFETDHSQYEVVALLIFASEPLSRFPNLAREGGPYDGHVLVLWSDRLIPEYGPYRYGLGYDEYAHLQITSLTSR